MDSLLKNPVFAIVALLGSYLYSIIEASTPYLQYVVLILAAIVGLANAYLKIKEIIYGKDAPTKRRTHSRK